MFKIGTCKLHTKSICLSLLVCGLSIHNCDKMTQNLLRRVDNDKSDKLDYISGKGSEQPLKTYELLVCHTNKIFFPIKGLFGAAILQTAHTIKIIIKRVTLTQYRMIIKTRAVKLPWISARAPLTFNRAAEQLWKTSRHLHWLPTLTYMVTMKTVLQHTTQDMTFQIFQKSMFTFIDIDTTAHHVIPNYRTSICKAKFFLTLYVQVVYEMVTLPGIVSVNIFV